MSRLLTAEFEHLSCFRYRRAEALVGTKELQSLAFELSSFDVAHQKALASFAGASLERGRRWTRSCACCTFLTLSEAGCLDTGSSS